MRAERRQRMRLVARDLGALAAFGAMAISGELPIWVLALFVVGTVLALMERRILSRINVASAVGLAAGALALYASVALGGLDLVVAACSFAALLTLQRMLSPPVPRTDQQVMLTSLLMISGGAALSGELLFALFLGAFAICATVSLGMSVVEGALPVGADFDMRPLGRRLGTGIIFALIAAMLFFVFIPRLSWNVAARRASKGLGATTGLSDGVRLGTTGGSIKTNPRIIARIELFPDPKKDRLDAYWVARTYGQFDGRNWEDAEQPTRPQRQVNLRPGARRLLHQQIELLPAYGANVAMAQVEPVLIGNATAHRATDYTRSRMVNVPGVEIRFEERGDGYSYHAYSASPSEPNLDAALGEEDRAKYLALPPLDPRIAALASQIAGGQRDPLAVAQRLELHLKSQYAYTLELPDSPADPLAHFLFERRAGHCEYYASALAVMLRTQGIPARVATGFFGGERVGDRYVVRAGDAHAWTQAWIEGRGFVNLDATPESYRAGQPSPLLDWVLRQYESLDAFWRANVLDFTFRDQAQAAFAIARATRGSSLRLPPRGAWIAAGVVALIVYGIWRVRTLRIGRASTDEATRMRERAERLLADGGVLPHPGEGIEELARRLGREGSPIAESVHRLSRRYVEARFGQRPLDPGEARAHELRLKAALEAQKRQGRQAA